MVSEACVTSKRVNVRRNCSAHGWGSSTAEHKNHGGPAAVVVQKHRRLQQSTSKRLHSYRTSHDNTSPEPLNWQSVTSVLQMHSLATLPELEGLLCPPELIL
jgi:hypothetical protein